MRPLLAIAFVLALVPMALLTSGCGDACGDLQAICNRCQDPNHKASCERSVDDDVQDVCEQDIDSFGDICN